MRAFSLVELSIVLVILGLLTGGILTGQSLIRAAELRAVSSEYQQYITAAYTFRDTYMAIPGDMGNATRFWGLQAGGTHCISNHGAGASAAGGTCDGNGDGMLTKASAGGRAGESFLFWQHLQLAGLIPGHFDGIAGSGGVSHLIAGQNAPASKLSNAAWEIAWLGQRTGTANYFSGFYGNRFQIGAMQPNAGAWDAAFSPGEVWNLDTKLDDGKPASGRLWVAFRTACTDSSGIADYGSSYLLSASGTLCGVYIMDVF